MMMSHLLLCVYILTFILGFPVNILAFCASCIKLRQEPTPIEVLLLNLSISNLIFLTFLPLKMKEAADGMEWNMPHVLCQVSNIIFFSCVYTITLLLTAVAVERYVAMTFPFKYKAWCRCRYVGIASVFFWLVSVANTSIIYIVPVMRSDNVTGTVAAEDQKPVKCHDYRYEPRAIVKAVRLELFLALFLVPLLICCFCYINFLRVTSQLPNITRERRLRAVGLAVVTFLVFAICFAPYNISHLVGYVYDSRSEGWRDVVLISATLTACLDLMMFYFSSTMRRAVSCCWRDLVEKLPVQRCPPAQGCPPSNSGKNTYYGPIPMSALKTSTKDSQT
ncbi:free fatty acid receptor 3-like [Sardina pilchardus]|uniref:free fatty acid receptor 3-like n=1 Tax=Sardina pilchardus TaxID=27697 RepID=UPI002E13D1F8